jgi:putative copper export protein
VSLTHHVSRSLLAAPAPSTPLGPVQDSVVTWTSWVTLMGLFGVLTVCLVVAGPPARRVGPAEVAAVTVRLARLATVLGVLAIPAVLTDLAHDAAKAGYDYGAAWNSLYDGTSAGRLSGLEITLVLASIALTVPLTIPRFAHADVRPRLLAAAVAASGVALATTKTPDLWSRSAFDSFMWMLHLLGGAIWIGGLAGLLALTLPGALAAGERAQFWSPAIRRFSVLAMTCVGAIALSGLWLYWAHVDGPTQLFTTMYGRVLGVKILIVGTMLLIGIFNQFWLHPRVDALRAAGDERALLTLLARTFPVTIACEVLLGLTVLLVAPFLHGSARNQAFQADAAEHATSAKAKLPKIAAKEVSASTWVWGSAETVAVIVVMAGGYQVSGRIARRRTTALVNVP